MIKFKIENFKYQSETILKNIDIVFESGKILIMAAKRRENIIDSYNYINRLLKENHEYVVKRNLFEIIANDPELCKLIDLEALSLIVDDL